MNKIYSILVALVLLVGINGVCFAQDAMPKDSTTTVDKADGAGAKNDKNDKKVKKDVAKRKAHKKHQKKG